MFVGDSRPGLCVAGGSSPICAIKQGRGSGELSACPRECEKSVLCTKRSFFFLARPVSSC